MKYEKREERLKIHGGIAYNHNQIEPTYLSYQPYDQVNYRLMYYAWANKKWDKFSVSLLFNNDGRQNMLDSTISNRQTLGFIPTYSSGDLTIGWEAYYQLGQNSMDQNVNAFLLSVHIKLKTKLTPITIGVDYASGTELNGDKNTDHSWNPLYGVNHLFYGTMDYFYVGNDFGQGGMTTGLIDYYLKTSFDFNTVKKQSLGAQLHYFMSPVTLYDLTDPSGLATVTNTIGTEIDLKYTNNLSPNVKVQVGYSQMFGTDALKQIKGMASVADGYTETGTNNWAWVMVNFNTNFFQKKSKVH